MLGQIDCNKMATNIKHLEHANQECHGHNKRQNFLQEADYLQQQTKDNKNYYNIYRFNTTLLQELERYSIMGQKKLKQPNIVMRVGHSEFQSIYHEWRQQMESSSRS